MGKLKYDLKGFIVKARLVHGDKFEYPEQEYSGVKGRITITCPVHGDFVQAADSHLNGKGCKACGVAKRVFARRDTWDNFVKKAIKTHGNTYLYPSQKYINNHTEVRITCPLHGDFTQWPSNHLSGYGCTECGVEKRASKCRDTWADFVRKASVVHGGRYTYPEQEYLRSGLNVRIICPEHGEFKQIANVHMEGGGCRKCSNCGTSTGEIALADVFTGNNAVRSYRVDISGLKTNVARKDGKDSKKMELDIYFRSRNVAVEYNGLYWHSESAVGRSFHKAKTDACNELGIDLIQVFEDEWHNKPDIVKSIINTRIGSYTSRYFARKTELVKVSAAEAGDFYDANHIQGRVPCKDHYGLLVGKELVAMASFGNRSHLFKNNDDLELIRFCTKLNTQVVGGLSKLLAVHKDITIKTYCDLRLFNGSGYKAVGFRELHTSPPSYFYIKGGKRFSRFNFQKHKLSEAIEVFDPALTEVENMRNNGYHRIFDCGTLVMELPPRVVN
jgi:hypothetical protein